MAGTTVTTLAKKKMVKSRAGISSLPKIVGMAFGDGGVDSGGTAEYIRYNKYCNRQFRSCKCSLHRIGLRYG